MKKRGFLLFLSLLLATIVLTWGAEQCYAEKPSGHGPQNVRERKQNVIEGLLLKIRGQEKKAVSEQESTVAPEQEDTSAPAQVKRPILTKSGRKAALKQATQDLFQAAPEAMIQPEAVPVSPTDETAVPHYFGPWPNWANSPYTLPDAGVVITGDGTGATATASVGAEGVITDITVTNPGSGYSTATVSFTGSGSGATAAAVINNSGVVNAVNVDAGGAGYTAPVATITGGGGTGAMATIYGGVDAVTIIDPGTPGYRFPTVDFDMPDGPNGVKAIAHALVDANGVITEIVVDQPGSGYSYAPNVVIRDGTLFDPILDGGSGATATTTLTVQNVTMDTLGSGYTSAPTVDFTDSVGSGSGALATAVTNGGAITDIVIGSQGAGYISTGGMEKFVDGLPQLCIPTANFSECSDPVTGVANNLGQYIPVAVPDTTTFSVANGFTADADYYVIALVQVREQMHSDLPPTLLREYVQLETPDNESMSRHIALQTDMVDGTSVPTLMPDGSQAIAVDNPHFLGPLIIAQKDKAVRVVFYNLLPEGMEGDLFMPKDSTLMGAGYGPQAPFPTVADEGTVMDLIRNPECTDFPSNPDCFIDSRATLHLHGGITPWISDGTPHQWITPANETTPWPEGVGVGNVPDMATPESIALDVPDCSTDNDGCQTFYWTNQQSARLMFYHDHAWGITRLNVYAGEAAGYLITDPTDQRLVDDGIIPADQIPLVVQDRTFVPGIDQLAEQDPTWDYNRWGGKGNFWYHHVYMPAQNPGDPSGMSAYGRWMYGPWFWPPATPPHGPIDNPYYDPSCDLDDPGTWTYQTDPFCEPQLIPGTPNISVGMEQFNDTPIVNGTAYPTVTVEPKAYRLRILNAANDRFFNFSLYVADPGAINTNLNALGEPIGGTEVAFNPAELAAAQLDPNIFPTPDTSVSLPGPNWIVIGSEGGFLPAPVVVPPQPTTWIIDPTVFNVGNVDKHSLLVAPAERMDVIVDFSAYAGLTLILYNDAPAAFPARVSTYDYYTGAPDQYPIGAPATLPGYGPNTRTVMQIKVAATAPAPAFNLNVLRAAFRHHADGSGVFESGQHPIIVGQAPYNSTYGTNFVASSYCNGGNATNICDGYLRIADQGGTMFGFNTLLGGLTTKLEIPIEPKAIHDEMNAAAFDEFGRMTANIGLEAVPATPAAQNITLYPFVNPPTELFDATFLPKNNVDIEVTPIASADGTQIWKITHNGVDTHPLHWHLYDLQVLNRVTWDNIVSPPDPTELGWKDTLRISPLEDTIVAIRPIIPQLPFELPNSVRPLHPMFPIGSTMGFNSVDAGGNPATPIVNQLVNFGMEYVWHCHILSHEEMDMMRPVAVALPPNQVSDLTFNRDPAGPVTLNWTDNSLNETQVLVQRTTGAEPWTTLDTLTSPLSQPNTKGPMTYVDPTANQGTTYSYRLVTQNTIGYGGDYMSLTAESISNIAGSVAVPSNVTAMMQMARGTGRFVMTWTDNSSNETGFRIQYATDAAFTTNVVTTTVPADSTAWGSRRMPSATDLYFRVQAYNAAGPSAWMNATPFPITIP